MSTSYSDKVTAILNAEDEGNVNEVVRIAGQIFSHANNQKTKIRTIERAVDGVISAMENNGQMVTPEIRQSILENMLANASNGK
jgi:hypothetical protein